jgi:hypothetical protein
LGVHVAQLRLEEGEDTGLPQAAARCSEQDQILDPPHQLGVVEQGVLHDQAAHAVRDDRERSVLRERSDVEPRVQMEGENRQVRIRRPDAALSGSGLVA